MTQQAYDSHCNLVLGDVEETIYVVEEDENEQETTRVGLAWVSLEFGNANRESFSSRQSRSKKKCSLCEVRPIRAILV